MEESDRVERLIRLFDGAPEEWKEILLKMVEERFPEPEYDKDEEY